LSDRRARSIKNFGPIMPNHGPAKIDVAGSPEIDNRIRSLEEEVARLRQRQHESGNQDQRRELKLAEVQLTLANQDKILAKIDTAVVGNGRPGLITRMDRAERWIATNTRALWLVAAAVIAFAVKAIVQK
jgi:hypothetical protein